MVIKHQQCFLCTLLDIYKIDEGVPDDYCKPPGYTSRKTVLPSVGVAVALSPAD